MDWITIDEEKCTLCGMCAEECLNMCLINEGDVIRVQADDSNCISCGHCVAVCPESALVHHKLNMENCEESVGVATLDPETFFQFNRQRRSHRHFLDKKIPRAELEKLIEICRYAPTGSNTQEVEIMLVEDSVQIKRLSDLSIDYLEETAKKIEAKAERLKAEGREPSPQFKYSLSRIETFKRPAAARDAGRDPVFFRAPAVMIFHSRVPGSAPKDNCVIAAQTVTLACRTLGLESCYIGLFEAAANYYVPIKEAMNLPPDHEVLSVLVLGYPKFEYARTVDRKPINVQWGLT